jgi:Amt family ammonium transporter
MHLAGYIPYPSWLSSGDNSWQLTAATLVGLMSLPGIAVLYGGLVKKKWAVNTMVMAFTGFSVVLIVWVLWAFKMSFGDPIHLGSGILGGFLGHPGSILGAAQEQMQAVIPGLSGSMPAFRFPQTTLAYFQFVFAAITPLLFLGSVLGRMNLKAWLLFVPAWTTCAYAVNAMLLWGGGYWAQKGALDYSGGYVIHLAAGVTGFVAAATIGPRSKRDRESFPPTNLLPIAIGAGLLWLGWNGFNGGDPYFAGTDAGAAVLNTNLATAAALLTWVVLDLFASKQRKPTFLGGVNGMIVGLVAITPAAGYVNGNGALAIGVIACVIVWVAWNYLAKVWIFKRVDDALGVVYTHGIAGLCGGLLVGVFADPKMIEYLGIGGTANASYSGAFYGHPGLVWTQLLAGLTIIVWDGVVTFVLLKLIGLFIPLRYSDEVLEIGDVAIHDEQVEPPQDAHRVFEGAGFTPAGRALAGAAAPTGGGPASEVTP